jgi:hypothetical protein
MVTPIPQKYGDPTQEHLRIMRAQPSRLRGVMKGITVPPPPSVDDPRVGEEMRVLLRHVASPALDPAFCEENDRDMAPTILRRASALGADVDPAEIADLISDLIPVIMRVKYEFNFPRPWQVAPAMGLSLRRLSTTSSSTPSYPSGHAIQAAAACSLIAERNSRCAREMDRLARMIGLTRLQLGVHFPMDILQGLKIGREIGRRIA